MMNLNYAQTCRAEPYFCAHSLAFLRVGKLAALENTRLRASEALTGIPMISANSGWIHPKIRFV